MEHKKAKTISVIGAGVMGREVTYQFAKYKYSVVLIDIKDEILNQALLKIRNIARLDMILNKVTVKIDEIIGRVFVSTSLEEVKNSEFIIENITENIELKKQLYQQLKQFVLPDAYIAVNTSAVSITKISSYMNYNKNVMGIHFMNPVHLKSTVEVIKGFHSSEEAIDKAMALLKTVYIKGVIVNDYPGFISNRVLMLTINEAIFALQDGVTTVENIDKIFRECLGHKMGPLETCDLIGSDTILNTLKILFDSYKDTKYRPAPLLQKMVDANLLGKKSGRGFYTYTN